MSPSCFLRAVPTRDCAVVEIRDRSRGARLPEGTSSEVEFLQVAVARPDSSGAPVSTKNRPLETEPRWIPQGPNQKKWQGHGHGMFEKPKREAALFLSYQLSIESFQVSCNGQFADNIDAVHDNTLCVISCADWLDCNITTVTGVTDNAIHRSNSHLDSPVFVSTYPIQVIPDALASPLCPSAPSTPQQSRSHWP